MTKNITCITCPNGCPLIIDLKTMIVTGNKCPRGEVYAKNEVVCPKRSLTSTCKTIFKDHPVVSVRTNGDIPKEQIKEAMEVINKIVVEQRLPIGSIVLKNILNSGIDVITTSQMEE